MLFKILSFLFKDTSTLLTWYEGYEDGYQQAIRDEKYRRSGWAFTDQGEVAS